MKNHTPAASFRTLPTQSPHPDDLLFASMQKLACEILAKEQASEGLEFVPESLAELYDAADPLFTAKNILRILNALDQYHSAAQPFDRPAFTRDYAQRFVRAYMLGREDERNGLPVPGDEFFHQHG